MIKDFKQYAKNEVQEHKTALKEYKASLEKLNKSIINFHAKIIQTALEKQGLKVGDKVCSMYDDDKYIIATSEEQARAILQEHLEEDCLELPMEDSVQIYGYVVRNNKPCGTIEFIGTIDFIKRL